MSGPEPHSLSLGNPLLTLRSIFLQLSLRLQAAHAVRGLLLQLQDSHGHDDRHSRESAWFYGKTPEDEEHRAFALP